MAIHREIYILAGLDHPNIAKLFEVVDTDTHVHLVMELCQGPNLYDLTRTNNKG
jgi:protein-serine/threonine kinase